MALGPGEKVISVDTPWYALVVSVDEDFERERRRELAYEFGDGRKRFYVDPIHAGAYADDFAHFLTDDQGNPILTSDGYAIVVNP